VLVWYETVPTCNGGLGARRKVPVVEVLANFERPDAPSLLHLRDALALAVQELRTAAPVRDAHGGERDQNDRGGNEKIGVRYGGHQAKPLAAGAT
jgi:hypothetical protein